MTEQKITQELPDNCDTCNATRAFMFPIEQQSSRAIGKVSQVVGYFCQNCETSHLYRMNAAETKPLEFNNTDHLNALQPEPEADAD